MRRFVSAGALVVMITAGCSGSDGDSAEPSATSDSTAEETESVSDEAESNDEPESNDQPESTTSTTTTTTEPAPQPEPEGEGFDVDREFSSDTDAEALGPIGTTETTIPTDAGEVSVGGGEVPELGDALPLPEGFEVQLSTEIEGEIGFSGRIDGELSDLVAFFDEALPAAGYTITERQEVPDVFTALAVEGPLNGDIVISQEPGGTGAWTILVALAEPDA